MKGNSQDSITGARNRQNIDTGLVALSPSAQVIVRDCQHIQFGVDPSQAAVLEMPQARDLAEILQKTVTPLPYEDLFLALRSCGLSSTQAWSILSDLLDYRVLIPYPESAFVTIVGRGLLRDTLSELFASAQLFLRSPRVGQTLTSYFTQNSPDITVLAHRRLSTISEATCLVQNCPTIIPIELIDGRAVIGPLRLNGRGACPLCLDLHRTECDPSWVRVMNSLPPLTHPEPIVATAAAAVGSAITQKALGRVIAPPGAQDCELIPGSVFLVDPLQFSIEHYRMRKHPRCPACFSHSNQIPEPIKNSPHYRNWSSMPTNDVPKRSIFTGPTPGIVSSSSREEGMDSAIARSVASEKTM